MISDWKFSGTKKHNGTDGAWFSEPKTAECTFSVTYPKQYKDVCIVAGSNFKGEGKKFWEGK